MLNIFYTGTSMYPTLVHGDSLHVEPYGNRPIRPGDVVVFSPDHDSHLVVHRIISQVDGGFVSMGDNNTHADSLILSPENIIGRVVHAENRRKVRHMCNGSLGLRVGALRRFRSSIYRKLHGLLHPAYRLLARSGLCRGFKPTLMQTKIVSINRSGKIEFQLIWRNCTIGRLAPGHERWAIKAPWRLFLDERTLPTSTTRNLSSPPCRGDSDILE